MRPHGRGNFGDGVKMTCGLERKDQGEFGEGTGDGGEVAFGCSVCQG